MMRMVRVVTKLRRKMIDPLRHWCPAYFRDQDDSASVSFLACLFGNQAKACRFNSTERVRMVFCVGSIPACWCLLFLVLYFAIAPTHAEVVANQPTARVEPLAEWNDFLTAPLERIEEPLSWMHWDAARLNRIAQKFNDVEFASPTLRQDYAFREAQIDARRLALTLTSGSDETLRATVDRMLIANPDYDIAALGERTRLYLDESDEIEARWSSPIGFGLREREEDYWRCFAEHPLALPIGKRLTLRAAAEGNIQQLRELELGLESSHADHPWSIVAQGQRQALEQFGKPFHASLPSMTGGLIQLPAVGKRTVLLVIGPMQTPSLECLDRIAVRLETTDNRETSIVIAALSESVSDTQRALSTYAFPSAFAILRREWQTPLLRQYDIRRLPTAMLFDQNGAMVEIVRASDWEFEVSVAVLDFIQSD